MFTRIDEFGRHNVAVSTGPQFHRQPKRHFDGAAHDKRPNGFLQFQTGEGRGKISKRLSTKRTVASAMRGSLLLGTMATRSSAAKNASMCEKLTAAAAAASALIAPCSRGAVWRRFVLPKTEFFQIFLLLRSIGKTFPALKLPQIPWLSF